MPTPLLEQLTRTVPEDVVDCRRAWTAITATRLQIGAVYCCRWTSGTDALLCKVGMMMATGEAKKSVYQSGLLAGSIKYSREKEQHGDLMNG